MACSRSRRRCRRRTLRPAVHGDESSSPGRWVALTGRPGRQMAPAHRTRHWPGHGRRRPSPWPAPAGACPAGGGRVRLRPALVVMTSRGGDRRSPWSPRAGPAGAILFGGLVHGPVRYGGRRPRGGSGGPAGPPGSQSRPPGHPAPPRTSRSAAAIRLIASAIRRARAVGTAPAPSWPRRERCRGAAASRSPGRVPVEQQHVGEVDVQRGQHLHRGQATRLEHAVEHRQRLPRLALVDGVGQLVARDVARLAEVRREVVGREPARPRRRRRYAP